MKFLKYLILINLLLILLQGVSYYSLKASEKYETQLEGFVEMTPKVLNTIENKKKEIYNEFGKIKSRTTVLLIILFFLILLLILIKNNPL